MDDFELNGIPSDEPISEPTPEISGQTEASGFYAWSGTTTEPAKATAPWQTDNSEPVSTADPEPEVPESQPERPARPKRPLLPLISIVACGALLVMLLTSIFIHNSKIKSLQQDYAQQLDSLSQQIGQLEGKLDANQSPITVRPPQNTATNDIPGTSGLMTPAQVYSQCVPSVVAINCTGVSYNNFGQYSNTASSGSGFVLSADGYIVTNYHVVEGSTSIEICMYDGTTYTAKYIGGNEANDIALIKVEAEDLPYVTIGSSSELIVGDQVAAIGNPLGELAATLTVGYVSAKDRIVTSEGTQINMLQTDAAINPGNSGGPLFNMYGEVVGITSAKYSGTTTSGATIEGIGFAIPTDDVIMMLEDLKNFGYVTGGYLGVTVSEMEQSAIQLYGLPQGVLVRDVMPGSCAEKAGMRSQDIIIDLGGNEVKNLNGLSRALNKFKGGQEVIVTVYRNGREVELTVVLDERPQDEEKENQVQSTIPTDPQTPWPGDSYLEDWFGQFFG